MQQRLIRIGEVFQITGLSRTHVYRLIQKGLFPTPIPLGTRSVAWAAHEVDAWVQARIAARSELASERAKLAQKAGRRSAAVRKASAREPVAA